VVRAVLGLLPRKVKLESWEIETIKVLSENTKDFKIDFTLRLNHVKLEGYLFGPPKVRKSYCQLQHNYDQ